MASGLVNSYVLLFIFSVTLHAFVKDISYDNDSSLPHLR